MGMAPFNISMSCVYWPFTVVVGALLVRHGAPCPAQAVALPPRDFQGLALDHIISYYRYDIHII